MNIKKLIFFSLGPIVSAILGLITLPYLTWFFTTEDIGRLTMLQAVIALSVSLFSLSLHQAYVREYNEVECQDSLFKECIFPGLTLLTVISIIYTITPFSVSEIIFGIKSKYLTTILLISIYCAFFINFFSHEIRMEERSIAFSLTQIAPKAFLLIFVSILVSLNIKKDPETLMTMHVSSIILVFFIYLCLSNIKITGYSVDFNRIKKMLSFSLPLVAGGIAFWGLTTMDRFFIRSYSGFDELGVYALAVTLASSIGLISTVFNNLWHPVLYKWSKNGINIKKLTLVSDMMLIFVSFTWSFVGVFSFILLYFLPPEYENVKYLILPCIAAPLFLILSETTSVGIGISRKSKYSMIASIIVFLINLILNYILTPKFGASGASVATLISFFIFFFIKTESSNLVWYFIPRLKFYIIGILYVLNTSFYIFYKNESLYMYLSWPALFILSCLLCKDRYKEIIKIKEIFKVNKC